MYFVDDIEIYTSNFNTLIQSKVQIFQLFAVALLCAMRYWIYWARDTKPNWNSNLKSIFTFILYVSLLSVQLSRNLLGIFFFLKHGKIYIYVFIVSENLPTNWLSN